MQTFRALKHIEVGQAEFELAIQFRFEKGEAYPRFGELAEPPTIELVETVATAPNGKKQTVNLATKKEQELEHWLLENSDRWE